MKNYTKPEMEITEFQYEDITNGNTSFVPVNISIDNNLKTSEIA